MKKTVLVVDNNQDTIKILTVILENEGYQVMTALDGATALHKVHHEKPHLVLLDMLLPVMNGIEVCRKIKEDSLTRPIPVMMITAKSDREARMGSIQAGADAYMLKPFDPADLTTRIDKMLKNHP